MIVSKLNISHDVVSWKWGMLQTALLSGKVYWLHKIFLRKDVVRGLGMTQLLGLLRINGFQTIRATRCFIHLKRMSRNGE